MIDDLKIDVMGLPPTLEKIKDIQRKYLDVGAFTKIKLLYVLYKVVWILLALLVWCLVVMIGIAMIAHAFSVLGGTYLWAILIYSGAFFVFGGLYLFIGSRIEYLRVRSNSCLWVRKSLQELDPEAKATEINALNEIALDNDDVKAYLSKLNRLPIMAEYRAIVEFYDELKKKSEKMQESVKAQAVIESWKE